MSTITDLYDKITNARHCAALTGAGVSTLSGIRDFRGEHGLYTEMDAEKMFDISYFEQDPMYYYKTAGSFIYNTAYQPSIVHKTLALMQKKGLLKALITQNIDFLHEKAGSEDVIEVHGSPAIHYCLRCAGVRVSFEEARKAVEAGSAPKCPKCGRILKPAITFFGEALPIDALRRAEHEAGKADLMLVLGTSLTVYPAAGLPSLTARNGGQLVIVNNQPTPLDRLAALHFDELGETFEELSAKLGSRE